MTDDPLRQALQSLSRQCGLIIFNAEKQPTDNAAHLRSWERVKKYIDDTLASKSDE
jgi:hypothetical protein